MREELRKKFILNRPRLVAELDVSTSFLALLLSKEVIKEEHKATIQSEKTPHEKADQLIEILGRRPDGIFVLFCEVLKDENSDLANLLNPNEGSTESAAPSALAASLAEQTGIIDKFKPEDTEKLAIKTDLENRKRIETVQNNRKDNNFLKAAEIGLASFSGDGHVKVVLEESKPKPEINILILGENGVGKSTWINSIVNYMTCPSLDVAREQKPPLSLIGSAFIIMDKNNQQFTIHLGHDKNEVNNPGTSATQFPQSYVFENEDKLIRLINTPGITDIRGIDQDKKNFDIILKYLANFDKLNCVCFLLKPDFNRLTVRFRYIIKELLSHLHKDVGKNIVFCITHTRCTFYRPGVTLPLLIELLQENKDVDIKLNKDNVYCVDNEAFIFLCALHHGIEFDEYDIRNFTASWDKSVAETNRMFNMIATLKPHRLEDTISMNEARKIIVTLTKPMAEISRNVQTSIAVVEDKRREIKSIKSKNSDQDRVIIQALECHISNLRREQQEITEVSAKLVCFLKTNAIMPYNDVMAEYLDILISCERRKVDAGAKRRTLDGMLCMQKAHKEEIQILDQSMNTGGNDSLTLGPEDVRKWVEELYKLPLSGKSLKEGVEVARAGTNRMVAYNEILYRPIVTGLKDTARTN